jgi:hypothetical protein
MGRCPGGAPGPHKALGLRFGLLPKTSWLPFQKLLSQTFPMLASPSLAAREGGIFITLFPKENQDVNTFEQRLQHCDQEIARASEESRKSHTETEHVGILLWEVDWRAE